MQVTNPAIDPLREGLVMSLEINIGKRRNILEDGPENASQVLYSSLLPQSESDDGYNTSFTINCILMISYTEWTKNIVTFVQLILSSPVLNEGELELLLKDPYLKPQVLPTFFDIRKGVEGSLEKTLIKLCEAADEAVRNGSQLLVLSDRSDDLVITPWFSLFHL